MNIDPTSLLTLIQFLAAFFLGFALLDYNDYFRHHYSTKLKNKQSKIRRYQEDENIIAGSCENASEAGSFQENSDTIKKNQEEFLVKASVAIACNIDEFDKNTISNNSFIPSLFTYCCIIEMLTIPFCKDSYHTKIFLLFIYILSIFATILFHYIIGKKHPLKVLVAMPISAVIITIISIACCFFGKCAIFSFLHQDKGNNGDFTFSIIVAIYCIIQILSSLWFLLPIKKEYDKYARPIADAIKSYNTYSQSKEEQIDSYIQEKKKDKKSLKEKRNNLSN